MKCEVCGSNVDKNWEFCPKCGNKMRKELPMVSFGLEDIFEQFGKEFEKMEKDMRGREKDFSLIDMRDIPLPKGDGAKGFTIKIVSKGGEKPKVDVQTFGDIKKEPIEQAVSKQLGFPSGERKIPLVSRIIPPKQKVTEEPKAKITQLPGKVLVELDLPGVKSLNDVEIKELEESAEIKAIAKDKVYFKIITLPPELALINKELKDGKLTLEFGY